MVQLKKLWELQEVDLKISAHQKAIEEAPTLSGLEEIGEKKKIMDDDLTFREDKLKGDRKIVKNLEMKIQKIVDDRKDLKDNLYSGKVTVVKELEQMHRKMDLLAEEKKKIEDELIAKMESMEEQEESVTQLKAESQALLQEENQAEKKLNTELDRYKKELSALELEHDELAGRLEQKYLNKYQTLADKYQGKALALVTDDICGGCRVFISSGLKGRLYNPDALVYCENCGRLLVMFDN